MKVTVNVPKRDQKALLASFTGLDAVKAEYHDGNEDDVALWLEGLCSERAAAHRQATGEEDSDG